MKRGTISFVDKMRRMFSPAFIVMLVLSFVLWYVAKLGYTYTTELPVNVVIDGEDVRVVCLVEGTGHRLLAHRFYINRQINLKASDLELVRSAERPDYYAITPYSLQSAISVRFGDIKIVSVGNIPEIRLQTAD